MAHTCEWNKVQRGEYHAVLQGIQLRVSKQNGGSRYDVYAGDRYAGDTAGLPRAKTKAIRVVELANGDPDQVREAIDVRLAQDESKCRARADILAKARAAKYAKAHAQDDFVVTGCVTGRIAEPARDPDPLDSVFMSLTRIASVPLSKIADLKIVLQALREIGAIEVTTEIQGELKL